MTPPRATADFTCEKTPVQGRQGIVIANAPPGSIAGAEVLASGGNAVDAAVASLLTLTVVEPMMVGIAGGGLAHVRLPGGEHVIFDGLATAGSAMQPDLYTPALTAESAFEVVGRRNTIGPSAVAVPGNLAAWHRMHMRFGRLPWADLVEPAIRAAERGFTVSDYMHTAILDARDDIARDGLLSSVLMPEGVPLAAGQRLVMGDYGQSLRLIRSQGAAALHGGALGAALADSMAHRDRPGLVSTADLAAYRVIERAAVAGLYRGHRIFGPPPPASSGVHIAQMLNMLEGFDLAAMGFGSIDTLHLLAEAMRIAFEDRRKASGDPNFVDIPVETYMSKDYARDCLSRIRQGGATLTPAPRAGHESHNTTHVTVADQDGMIVTATHTINGLFGACYMVPGTGIIPNNYMQNFDPTPGNTMSILPGKRVPTSMAPIIVEKDGQPRVALGLPGGTRIFTSAMQMVVNLIDHGMTLQEAVEAPRIWTDGGSLLIEPGFAARQAGLESLGHRVTQTSCVGGGMNAIAFGPDGMTGAACWRADGVPVALGGGMARAGIQFRI